MFFIGAIRPCRARKSKSHISSPSGPNSVVTTTARSSNRRGHDSTNANEGSIPSSSEPALIISTAASPRTLKTSVSFRSSSRKSPERGLPEMAPAARFSGMGWVSFACASWRAHQANIRIYSCRGPGLNPSAVRGFPFAALLPFVFYASTTAMDSHPLPTGGLLMPYSLAFVPARGGSRLWPTQTVSLSLSLAKIISRPVTGQELLSQKVGPTLSSKAIHVLNKHTIRIVRAITAITIIPQSNKPIRPSYDCMLLPPPSEIRLGETANPLAFTSHFYNR